MDSNADKMSSKISQDYLKDAEKQTMLLCDSIANGSNSIGEPLKLVRKNKEWKKDSIILVLTKIDEERKASWFLASRVAYF